MTGHPHKGLDALLTLLPTDGYIFLIQKYLKNQFGLDGPLEHGYKDFSAFKSAIMIFLLNETQTIYKDELDSLLTLRFQTFTESQTITV